MLEDLPEAAPQAAAEVPARRDAAGDWSLVSHLARVQYLEQVGGSVYLVWQPGEVAAGTEQHNQSLLR